MLIDPGADPKTILNQVEKAKLKVKLMLSRMGTSTT